MFPACERCNSGSRKTDEIVALLSLMDPNLPVFEGQERTLWEKRIQSANAKHPGLFQEMLGFSATEKKTRARTLGVERAPGETFADLPFMRVTPSLDAMVREFAAKVTKALHFEHTGVIVPSGAFMKLSWWTNATAMEGSLPEALFQMPFNGASTKRGSVDLSDQFTYRWLVTEDGASGAFICTFRFAFGFAGVVAFPPSELARAVEAGEVPTAG